MAPMTTLLLSLLVERGYVGDETVVAVEEKVAVRLGGVDGPRSTTVV